MHCTSAQFIFIAQLTKGYLKCKCLKVQDYDTHLDDWVAKTVQLISK